MSVIALTAPVPSIPPGPALSNDFHFAKECMKTIFYFKFIAEEINRLYNLMHQAALCFRYSVIDYTTSCTSASGTV